MTRLKLRHLTLLRNIALHGSLTRVAQETGVSQPAITKALAEIESLFGASLFIRSGRGLKPTAMGELAMLKARHMLQELDHWASEMERSEEHTSELQSLMRTSYAVFCLKKKKSTKQDTTHMLQRS